MTYPQKLQNIIILYSLLEVSPNMERESLNFFPFASGQNKHIKIYKFVFPLKEVGGKIGGPDIKHIVIYNRIIYRMRSSQRVCLMELVYCQKMGVNS